MNRLDALARDFGADTSAGADWTLPLPRMAVEVYHDFMVPGGTNGYARYGKDALSAAVIVNSVFEAWARSEHVSVEWFNSLDNRGGMLRTFAQQAAQNLVNVNAAGSRQGVAIVPTGMTGAGIEDPGAAAEVFMTPGGEVADKFDWLTDSAEFASEAGNPEAEFDFAQTFEALAAIPLGIVSGISNLKYRALAALYYVEGYEVAEAAAGAGMKLEAGKKALQRVRADMGEEDAAALQRWRRGMYPDSGRQPLNVGDAPKVFTEALGS